MSSSTAITKVDLSQYDIKKIASGKVREIFEIDDQTLLFVATDRISAYDVILNNVRTPCIVLSGFCCCFCFTNSCFISSIDQAGEQTSQ